MLNWIFGSEGGGTKAGHKKMIQRDRLSEYLPYKSYDETDELYSLTDGTFGYLWEVQPVAYAGDSILSAIKRLLNMDLPKTAIMQFILYADPYVGSYFDRFQSLKTRNSQVVKDNVSASVRYWRANQSSVQQIRGVPLRNFRFFVALKDKSPIDSDVIAGIRESLSKFGCVHLPASGSNGLVSTLRRFFGDMQERQNGTIDPLKPLRKQILSGGAAYRFKKNPAQIGKQFARCFTPQAIPQKISAEKINRLFGGIMGVTDDSRQIPSPFLFSLTVFFKNCKSEIYRKAQVVGAQKGGAKFSRDTEKRTEEFQWLTDLLESGEKILKYVPVMWVFGFSEEEVRESVSRAKGMWDDLGFAVQDECCLNKPLLIMSLPFGFYDDGNNLSLLDRDFMAPVSSLALLVPIQADFRGAGQPAIMLFGRKGQMVTCDLCHPSLNNRNFVVAAESGAGKSFFLNNLTNQYYAQGAKIRIIDIGYSYQKSCSIMGGRFLDVGADATLCINPFDFKTDDLEERQLGIQTASDCLALMCSSASGRDLDEDSLNLLKLASRWVVDSGRGTTGVDAAREYLSTFPACLENIEASSLDFLIEKAKALAFNLQAFCSEGEYGRYFNGKSTFNISKDDYVVLELERLRQFPQLFSVIVLQIMNAVTQDLYLGDRSIPSFILFEEAAAFLKDNLAGGRANNFKSVIEAGYRRARKYGGSFGVVVQSVMDLQTFGDVGGVIWDNAATKFLLQGETYGKAAAEKVIEYDGFALDLLKSVTNNKPNYSEVFISSAFGTGVARIVVDPHSYWMNTSAAEDVARYSKLVAFGQSPAEAIDTLVKGNDSAVLAKRLEGPNVRAAQ